MITSIIIKTSSISRRLSANSLQEHFTLPYAGLPPIRLSVPAEERGAAYTHDTSDGVDYPGGMGLFTPEGPAVNAEEEAFIRAMQRKKKKKKRRGLGM